MTDFDTAWWMDAVVYQVYPRSFNDTDGDGVGDLPGVTAKADYLADLGVDLVWLCPVYDSPNQDNGYDIRDYRSIHDEFGTMADWEALRDALHARDIRLIMDLVVNHTSREHEWFQRSRRGDDDYYDYYHWVDVSPDEPPNNWQSIFGGPAWTYDDERGAWYLHLFDENQPDLNWRNPAVSTEVEAVVEWWLEKGIDGFRLDAIDHLSKTDAYPDGDPDAPITGLNHFSHGPRLTEYLRGLYEATFANYDVVTVGEMGSAGIHDIDDYTGEDDAGLDMVFQFAQTGVDVGPRGRWDPDGDGEWDLTDLKAVLTEKQNNIEWDALFLGNHDQPRVVSRFGDTDQYRRESATLIATCLLTLRGTPYIYQGEEIGMTNASFKSLDEVDDPMTVGKIEELLAAGDVENRNAAMELVNRHSRDHARTPMQWTEGEHAGFTDGDPWLKANVNHPEINVADQWARGDSVLAGYRNLIALRHREKTLVYGDYDLHLPEHDQFYTYTRRLDDDAVLVVLNWSDSRATLDFDVDTGDATVLYGNYDGTPAHPSGAAFRPYEAAVYRL